jgi:hypothetical protein
MIVERGAALHDATIVGGQPLPAAVNNFAKNRRFGLRMLAE